MLKKIDNLKRFFIGVHNKFAFQRLHFFAVNSQNVDVIIDNHIQQCKRQVIGSRRPDFGFVLADSFTNRVKHIAFLFLKRDKNPVHHNKAQVIHHYPALFFVEFHHFQGNEKTVIEFFRLRTRRRLHHIRKDVAGNGEDIRYIADDFLVVQPVNIYPGDGIGTRVFSEFFRIFYFCFTHFFQIEVDDLNTYVFDPFLSPELQFVGRKADVFFSF